jgi:hypothetical protein
VEDRIEYFERMLADNPDNPTGLLALANEYNKAARYEDETHLPLSHSTTQFSHEYLCQNPFQNRSSITWQP